MREAIRACDGGGVICDVGDMALAPFRDSTLSKTTLAMNRTAVAGCSEHTGRALGTVAVSVRALSVLCRRARS